MNGASVFPESTRDMDNQEIYAKYKGYVAKIEQDSRTDIMRGHVVDIKDVVVFEAETFAQAEQEFHKSIDVYLIFCKRLGKEPKKSLHWKDCT